MDHTIEGYLRQLPTKTLEQFLKDYTDGKFQEDFSYAIAYITQVLAERKAEK